MIKRLVEIGQPARLRLAHRQLVVQRRDAPTATVPMEDLGVLILDHDEITLTKPMLLALAEAGAALVICDDRHLPAALCLPLSGHCLHAKVIVAQADASRPRAKRLWQQVTKAKIQAQAACLEACGRPGAEIIRAFADQVRSGDPENHEAQAARAYWPRLFGDEFRRDQSAAIAASINQALNYGYAVIRAAVARACVGSGLHPALGIHHDNQYNAFALADDLMEPLRPLVDEAVWRLHEARQLPPEIDRGIKSILIGILTRDLRIGDGRRMPFLSALPFFTAAVVRWLAEESDDMPLIPCILPEQPETEP